jgi:hypothetical protein
MDGCISLGAGARAITVHPDHGTSLVTDSFGPRVVRTILAFVAAGG